MIAVVGEPDPATSRWSSDTNPAQEDQDCSRPLRLGMSNNDESRRRGVRASLKVDTNGRVQKTESTQRHTIRTLALNNQPTIGGGLRNNKSNVTEESCQSRPEFNSKPQMGWSFVATSVAYRAKGESRPHDRRYDCRPALQWTA
jgi:hypothetical protein